MHRIICLLVVLGSPLMLVADENVQQELKALQGTWKAVAMEAGGKPLPKEATPEFTFIIGAEGKSTGKMAQGEYSTTITVDPRKTPRTMDNLHESGGFQGKKQYGVYKLEGDKLTVCMTAPGRMETDRPKDFNTKDTPHVVFVFERLKEGKKP
jgi:uncharacterized protein (TIGR03067 family)